MAYSIERKTKPTNIYAYQKMLKLTDRSTEYSVNGNFYCYRLTMFIKY